MVSRDGTTEHVVIRDTKGNLTSDSYCDAQSGRYSAVVAFGIALKAAVSNNSPGAVAASMSYPLRVNTGPNQGFTVRNRADLLARFRRVFTGGVLARLRALEPHDVFCRDGQSMLAGGTVWAQAGTGGVVRGVVVNR